MALLRWSGDATTIPSSRFCGERRRVGKGGPNVSIDAHRLVRPLPTQSVLAVKSDRVGKGAKGSRISHALCHAPLPTLPALSIRADPRRPNRLCPALDILGQELGKIFRRTLLRRNDFQPQLFQAPAQNRV